GSAFGLWKTLAPARLVPLYELVVPFEPWRRPFLLSGLAVAALSALFWAARRRFPAGLAVWAAYLIALAPMMGFVALGRQRAAAAGRFPRGPQQPGPGASASRAARRGDRALPALDRARSQHRDRAQQSGLGPGGARLA